MSVQFKSKSLKVALDTRQAPADDRLSFWQDEFSKLYVQHQLHVGDPATFSARAETGSSSGYDVSVTQMSQATLERSHYHARTDEAGRCFLCMVLNGDVSFVQDDVVTIPQPGQIFLIRTSGPYKLVCNTPVQLLQYKVACEDLRSRLGNVKRYAGVTTTKEDPIGDVASAMMRKVAASLDFSGDVSELRTLEATFELATTALRRSADAAGANLSSCQEIVLARLEHAIARQIGNPELDAAALAREVGISIRYANKVLAERGTSLMRYVKDTRLERCARMLEDPSQRRRSITEIAMSLGFNDMSHFSRAFRERFDVSPRDYRMRLQRAEAEQH